jgi:hypothetical protein
MGQEKCIHVSVHTQFCKTTDMLGNLRADGREIFNRNYAKIWSDPVKWFNVAQFKYL